MDWMRMDGWIFILIGSISGAGAVFRDVGG